MLQNATTLWKSPPGPPKSWWTCLLYCACHGKCIFADPLQTSHAGNHLEMLQNPHVFLTFAKVHNPLRLPRETISERPKVVRTLRVFSHFNFEMCFAPQRRALFRHLNFQKWSEPLVFFTFWLRNVLRATTACTFSTSQFPKVVREWCVCAFWLRDVLRATTGCNFSSLIWPAGSARAALASLLVDPLEPQIIGKTQFFATFLPFRAPASSFFWLFLFSDLSSALLFSILLLHLCFSSVHIVGSLTSKLPSIMSYHVISSHITTLW